MICFVKLRLRLDEQFLCDKFYLTIFICWGKLRLQKQFLWTSFIKFASERPVYTSNLYLKTKDWRLGSEDDIKKLPIFVLPRLQGQFSVCDNIRGKRSRSITGQPSFVDLSMFLNMTESTIANAPIRTRGSSVPSGLDGWRKIFMSKNFGAAGHNLLNALTLVNFARKISTVGTKDLISNDRTYTACRLVSLDKNPGGRPSGVGKVLRRSVGKSILSVIKPEILSSTGNLQRCAGQTGGCEAAVPVMSNIFEKESTDALLLKDTDNAFNSLNQKVLLHNIKYLCPPMAIYIRN